MDFFTSLRNKSLRTMSEKFSLKWNDYQSNWNRSLSELRNDSDLADVTLISEDKVKFSAHKLLLSSCSKMFKIILKGINHTNPLLYLGGVSSVNLGFILDYIYHGEVNLYQEQLDSFLESAQKLEVEGLLGDHQDTQKVNKNEDKILVENYISSDEFLSQQPEEKQIVNMKTTTNTRRQNPLSTSYDTAKFDVGSMTPDEIQWKTESLYEKKDGAWRCLACDYITTCNSGTMKRHIETHFEGLSYTCTFCSKQFRSTNSLYKHNSKAH